MEKELTLLDVLLMIGRACKRMGRRVVNWFCCACRITWRKWWIVLPVVALFIAGSLYYSRLDNRIYKAYAVATLHGPSLLAFDDVFRPLCSGAFVGEQPAIAQAVKNRTAYRFETFPVVDCLRDSTIDYIDFDRKSTPSDTIQWQMRDHICIQFRIKHKDLPSLPSIEHDLLTYLNTNPSLLRDYEASLQSMDREVLFCHTQIEKLDSLTSAFYFQNTLTMGEKGNTTIVSNEMNNRRIRLFLPEIYSHFDYTRRLDIRRAKATAPVVLASHFALNPHPVNGRLKMLLLFALVGWIVGVLLGSVVGGKSKK